MATEHIHTHSGIGLMRPLESEIVTGQVQESDCADALDAVQTVRDQGWSVGHGVILLLVGTDMLDSKVPVESWIGSLR